MICSHCGGLVVWKGPITNLTYTECQRCGATNCQVAEDESDSKTLPTKALSIRQPWAWAVAAGFKTIENRHWNRLTPGYGYRGAFALHASLGMTMAEYDAAYAYMKERGVICPEPHDLVRGAIIGTAVVSGAVKKSTNVWFMGPYGLLIDGATMLDQPIPCSGALGFFYWKPSGGEIAPPAKWMLPKTARPARHDTQETLL